MTYDSNVLALSPKHFWKMDETSGTTAVDYGTTPVNGVYNNGPVLNQAALSCPSGSPGSTISSDATVLLDGVNDSMTVATNPNYTALTVCMWIKAGASADGYWFGWGWSGGSLPINIGGGTGFGTSSKWSVGMFSGSSWYSVDGSDVVSGAERFILATVSSGGSLRMWENGRFKGQVAVSSFPAYSSGLGLRVGQRWDGGNSAGRVGGLALWDTVLSDAQILTIVPPPSYGEQTNLTNEGAAPNASPWRPYGEGGTGGGSAVPTTGQIWPRGGRG